MDRINHVKIVSPDPTAIEAFLTEVLDVPAGWSLGALGPPGPVPPSGARDASGAFTREAVMDFRGATGGGLIAGSTGSRQFQIFEGERAHIWAVAIGTRHLERAHERCTERGIPCTPIDLTQWGDGGIRYFFAEVGGIVFEVLRAEESGP